MTWLSASEHLRSVETRREAETERDRLRRLAAIRSRTRTSQQPLVALVEPKPACVAPDWTKELPQRRRILTPAERRAIIRDFRTGRPLRPTLDAIGVSRTVYYRLLRADEGFAAQVFFARTGADDDGEATIWTMLEVPGHTMGRREYVTRSGMVRESSCCSCGWQCDPKTYSRAGVIAAWKRHVSRETP